MSPKEFDQLVEATFDKLRNLIRVKGGEYAEDTERFENFIRNGKRLDLNRMTIWAVYFNKHVDAINSYIAGLQKGNIRESSEPIEGRFEDAMVYLLLGLGMVTEENKSIHSFTSQLLKPGWYFIEKEGEEWRPWPLFDTPYIEPGGLKLPDCHYRIEESYILIPTLVADYKCHGICFTNGLTMHRYYVVKGKIISAPPS